VPWSPTSAERAGDPERGLAKIKSDPKYASMTVLDKQFDSDPDIAAFRKRELDRCITKAFADARQKAVRSAAAAHLRQARREPSAKSARTHKRIGEGFFASVWS